MDYALFTLPYFVDRQIGRQKNLLIDTKNVGHMDMCIEIATIVNV